jgi:valyl-tRNA synthetase
LAQGADAALIDDVAEVLTQVRKVKSDAKASMRAEISSATVAAPDAQGERIALAAADIKAAGRITELSISSGDQLRVAATLAPVTE